MPFYQFENRIPRWGQGTFIADSALIIGDVRVGKHVYVGHGVILRGDYGTIIVGDKSAIEEGAIIHARSGEQTVVGKSVTVGHGAMIHNAHIKDFAVIGMRATISDYSEVGKWAIIGEMGLVKNSQHIPDNSVAVGIPAKVIRKIDQKQKDFWGYGKELYVEMAQRYNTPGAFKQICPPDLLQ
ncbi:MAG: gamma carbonic anhydrase family protein [Candidatus Aminicenantes bacterium]|jgi:carbonic anhydrase/acetyltransferase-like protein (isoleucine patch superfamily)